MQKWYVARGRHRIVIVIPSARIALKVPRVWWRAPIYFLQNDIFSVGKGIFSQPPEKRLLYYWYVGRSFHRCLEALFGGVWDNWRERNFYKYTDALTRLFLQPTYFSFLGLVNIQRYGKPVDVEDSEAVALAFFAVARQALVHDDEHHWEQGANFHIAGDGPKILDYGSPRTQKIVQEWGFALYAGFDLEFGRAEAERFKQSRNF